MENTEAKLTREEQKDIAISRLQQMGIYSPYIKAFKNKNIVTMFENFGGYWATADNGEAELEAKIKEFEAKTGNLVYAVTHELLEFGECYSFLIVSAYKEDEAQVNLEQYNATLYAFAYVWNKTYEEFSEYGTIGVQSFGGGIRRCE